MDMQSEDEIKTRYEDVCGELNLDEVSKLSAWEVYVTINNDYVLEVSYSRQGKLLDRPCLQALVCQNCFQPNGFTWRFNTQLVLRACVYTLRGIMPHQMLIHPLYCTVLPLLRLLGYIALMYLSFLYTLGRPFGLVSLLSVRGL